MLFSVITLCYNKLDCTRRCLSAMLRDTRCDAPWELVVVDNGSSDGTQRWLEHELPALGRQVRVPVRLLRLPSNQGSSTGRNLGIGLAAGEFLVFVDNDVAPCTRGWLAGLHRVFIDTPAAGMAAPKMIYPFPPYAIQCAGVGISRRGHVCFQGRGEAADDPRFNRRQPAQCLISACMMVRAELIRKHGGFDPCFNPVQFEDFDLCYRLREQGWKAVYTPEVAMYHFESITTQGSPSIHNASVVVRNGLIFQRRWRHLFSKENGPDEAACRWRRLDASPSLDAIVDPPLC
jgi:GT2 family glycosyltransferase